MKTTGLIILLNLASLAIFAQDSTILKRTSVTKDQRIDLLGKKMAEYNESLANKTQMVKGFRLMLLSTTDRNQAIELRSTLMQQYPEQKVYMIFLSPYIKIKFGNFIEKEDAEKMRKELAAAKIVTGNIYVVPEMVEQKPEKPGQQEETN